MSQTSTQSANYYREMLDQLLRSLPEFPENRFEGRGIVLCGGGNVYFPCIWVCIRMLRSFGCTLPIELWHRGPHEMTDQMKALLEPYAVECRDAFAMAREFPVRRLDGWELKPYAILNSRFAEVLYIDADNVVLRDPEFLFNTDLYRKTGSLFWPDVTSTPEDQTYLKDVSWKLLDLQFREEAEFEAGQLLIDKRRCWRPMQLTLHLNEHSDYYYTAFFGDKDTFRLAWHKLEQEYSIIPHPPKVLGHHFVMIQFDPEGKRLFQHRCNAKWKLTERNRRIPGFLREDECLAFLRELRTNWPAGCEDSSFTRAEQVAFDELANKTFRGHTNGREAGDCFFQPDFIFSWGAQTFGWRIEEDKDGDAVLIITHADSRLCFLRKTAQGSWRGNWRYGDRALIEIWPQKGT